jgi:tellurite resistance protein TehA-like permease
MTGSWLIVRWVGVAIAAFYLVLIVAAIRRCRTRFSQIRSGLYVPIVIGNFISLSVPWLFENVVVTRACFVIAQLIFVRGIWFLLRGLAQPDCRFLLKGDS